MVVVEIVGGLGNQMFQYACGKSLAIKNNTELKLDLSCFNFYDREYALSNFNVNENILLDQDAQKLKHWQKIYRLTNLKNKFLGKPQLIYEKGMAFDSSIESLVDSVFLRGYWGSFKYFDRIESVIRKDFTLKNPLTKASDQWANQIEGDRASVSLHIRRGDYIASAINRTIYKIIPVTYYQECIERLKENFENLTIYVFSNDMPWVKKNLKFEVPTYFVDNNDENHGYEDMYLMSLCRHHVIANSTFSWWGAWLDPRKGKLVFSPQEWFNIHSTQYDIRDLIPGDWMKI